MSDGKELADWPRGGTALGDWSRRLFAGSPLEAKGGGEEFLRRRRGAGRRPLRSPPRAGETRSEVGPAPSRHVGLPAERRGRGSVR